MAVLTPAEQITPAETQPTEQITQLAGFEKENRAIENVTKEAVAITPETKVEAPVKETKPIKPKVHPMENPQDDVSKQAIKEEVQLINTILNNKDSETAYGKS